MSYLEKIGILLILIGAFYLVAGIVGIAPLTLEGNSFTNIRVPGGVAVIGCLLAAFATKDK